MSETTILENNPQMNEETIYENSNVANEENTFAGEINDNVKAKPKNGKSWATVTLGGAAAILMGAAGVGIYAYHAHGKEPEPVGSPEPPTKTNSEGKETEAKVEEQPQKPETDNHAHDQTAEIHHTGEVHHVHYFDDVPYVGNAGNDLSFSEAFAQARAEVGPGGVFYWHGGLYNTYYVDEWNAMTPAERAEFAQQVPVAVPATKLVDLPTDDAPEITYTGYEETGGNDAIVVDEQTADNFKLGDDVHVVGYGENDGHLVVGYDNNNDTDVDFAIIDVDDSRDISDPDVIIDSRGNSSTVAEVVNTNINTPSTTDNVATVSNETSSINALSENYDENIDADNSPADDSLQYVSYTDDSSVDNFTDDSADMIDMASL